MFVDYNPPPITIRLGHLSFMLRINYSLELFSRLLVRCDDPYGFWANISGWYVVGVEINPLIVNFDALGTCKIVVGFMTVTCNTIEGKWMALSFHPEAGGPRVSEGPSDHPSLLGILLCLIVYDVDSCTRGCCVSEALFSLGGLPRLSVQGKM